MPNKWTFEMNPVKEFLGRWLIPGTNIADPFSGKSTIANLRNDLAHGGKDAIEWCYDLLPEWDNKVDAVLFDPPYSPRQISECYKGIGRKVTMKDTQSGSLYKEVRIPLAKLLKPGGVALSFGWNSSGFGKDWETHEIMLLRHGGAHNDTICVAQTKPLEIILKILQEAYGTKDFNHGMSDYYPLFTSLGYEILASYREDDWQGQSLIIFKNKLEYGFINYSWGSCSGCDSLQGCDDRRELEQLRKSYDAQIQWFSSKKTCLTAIQEKFKIDNDFTKWNADIYGSFVALAEKTLGEEIYD